MKSLFSYGMLVSLLLAEASWIFLASGLLGALFGVFGPIIPWVTLLLLLMPGCIIQRLIILSIWLRQQFTQLHILFMGFLTIYLIVSINSGLFWPIDLITWRAGTSASFNIFLYLGIGIFMWRRGLWIGGHENPGEALKTIFPIGFILATVGGVVEAISGWNLGFTPVIFILFGACLSGLAFSYLINPEDSRKNYWKYSPLWAVAFVLISGAIFILLAQTPLSALAFKLLELLSGLFQFVLAIIMVPVEYILRGVFAVMTLFINWLSGEESIRLAPTTEVNFLEQLRDRETEPRTFFVMLSYILTYLFIFLVISTIIVFLYLVLWVRLKQRFRPVDENDYVPQRETIPFIETEPVGEPLESPVQANIKSPYHDLPNGMDPTSKVLRAYYQLLNFGLKQGKPRSPRTTPTEYQPELTGLVGGNNVSKFTSEFNNTYYALITPSIEVANDMEKNVDTILGALPPEN